MNPDISPKRFGEIHGQTPDQKKHLTKMRRREIETLNLVNLVSMKIKRRLLDIEGVEAIGPQRRFNRQVIVCFVDPKVKVVLPKGLPHVPIVKEYIDK